MYKKAIFINAINHVLDHGAVCTFGSRLKSIAQLMKKAEEG